jgi:hypothetical protein
LSDEIVSASNQAAEKKTQKDPLAQPVTPIVVAAASAVSLHQTVVISTANVKNKARPAIKMFSAAMKPPPPPKVPLTTSMLLEMANGMEMDPEANLKLVSRYFLGNFLFIKLF